MKIMALIMCGLVIGGVLQLAKWWHPELPLWVIAFMLACLSANLSIVSERLK